ncbi:Transcription factor WhiB [Propionibacterium australiense]|uniref:Transcriptional regulator WhiB n=1 Tax=Propionibacterium australiense TaxID=119981 RepID=A0A383S4X6_9ACTN|nr:WhiB family transcriptional regulator [Propionibacterium australiense]RLP08312.1 WhiB family transcriptional regulator [Propionibacterium australiense]SYZ33068.1 4Fe-4S WhiB-like (Wbl)-type iron-sulfur binding domain profile [Propionibacterium australiense]VEH89056.1 Transcription factor WhiB [Propionibacterium australiense]
MAARNEGRPRTGEEYEWMMQAACRGMGDDLFPEASEQQSARSICTKCPVRRECLAVALDDRIEWGIWGGMTERERRALLRERPCVKSWWDAFGLNAIKTTVPGRPDTMAGGTLRPTPLGTMRRTDVVETRGPLTVAQAGPQGRLAGYGGAAAPGTVHRGTGQERP